MSMTGRDDDVIRKKARADFLQRFLIYVGVLLLAGALVAILIDMQTGKEQRDLILSCTTQTGECYQDNVKRTAEAVGSIDQSNQDRSAVTRQISVYAAYCSQVPGLDDVDEFETCIRKLLKIEGDSFEYQKKEGNK